MARTAAVVGALPAITDNLCYKLGLVTALDDSILDHSAVELGRRLASGDVASLELTDAYLARIERLNGDLSAFTYVARRRARAAAARWDRARVRGQHRAPSPFSGVPTAIKDLAMVRGMPTRFGSRAFPPLWATKDGVVTRRIRSAGMVILGKLTTAEFGAMPVTEPDIHPPTRNPFDQRFTAGGSSGGSGAAVAAGLIPIAQGSDGAGSIRIPSALGHLVGIKATRGLISHITPVDRELRLATVGPLGRTVEDIASFLDIISDEPHDFAGALQAKLPGRLRIALSIENKVAETAPEYADAARRVADVFEASGHHVEERAWIDAPVDDFLIMWKRLMANTPWLLPSRIQPITAWLRDEGKGISKSEALATRRRLEGSVLDWFGDVDLWISPTMATKPPKIGAWRSPSPEQSFRTILGMGAYTAVFNVSGQPAISIPMGFDRDSLPIGVQIAGKRGSDALLLRSARLIEESQGGFRVPPPV